MITKIDSIAHGMSFAKGIFFSIVKLVLLMIISIIFINHLCHFKCKISCEHSYGEVSILPSYLLSMLKKVLKTVCNSPKRMLNIELVHTVKMICFFKTFLHFSNLFHVFKLFVQISSRTNVSHINTCKGPNDYLAG